MSNWRRIGGAMDPHLDLFLVFVIDIIPFLLLFLLRNIDWVLAIAIRLLYISAAVVVLKKRHDEAER
jgi:hypothetical protein